MKRTFHKIKCPYCEQIISSNGLGWASHMRKHVREGILIERREVRRKRDRGPSRYLPRDEFQCEYVYLWDQIPDKYDLQLSSIDRCTISRILNNDCDSFNPEAQSEDQQ